MAQPEQTLAGKDCEICGHPFDPHSLVATSEDPLDGGVILCPVKDCECYATWSMRPKTPPARIPDRFELAHIREHIQA